MRKKGVPFSSSWMSHVSLSLCEILPTSRLMQTNCWLSFAHPATSFVHRSCWRSIVTEPSNRALPPSFCSSSWVLSFCHRQLERLSSDVHSRPPSTRETVVRCPFDVVNHPTAHRLLRSAVCLQSVATVVSLCTWDFCGIWVSIDRFSCNFVVTHWCWLWLLISTVFGF